jgi:CRISPR system Cascade subunit CasA
MAEFNLVSEPWIPCIDPQGQRVELGIRDTLIGAHELREICDDSPLVTVAIHRLLLAILYRAYEGPVDMVAWKSLYQNGQFAFNDALDRYFQQWHDRFYLFDDKHPFMQISDLDLNDYHPDGTVRKDKSDGLMRLVREAPDKNGKVLFDHRVATERTDYEPKQIARMILSAQSYSGTGVASAGKVGERKIMPTPCQFAPCVEGLVLWLQGYDLFKTLLLNLVPMIYFAADKPAWEDDSIVDVAVNSWKKPVTFVGPVQRFASQSRFVRVLDQRSMFFTNGLKTTADANDPMNVYSRADEQSPFQPLRLKADRASWRDAHTLFSSNSTSLKPPKSMDHIAIIAKRDEVLAGIANPTANIVGLATDRGKALLWRHERMPVPATLLADVNLIERLGTLLREAENVGFELNNRVRRIAKLYLSPDAESHGGRKPDNDEVAKVADAIDPRPAYWARLEKHFFGLLDNLPADWDIVSDDFKPEDQQSATSAWHGNVKDEARRALEESIRSFGTTARAVQAVARVRTDFYDADLKPRQRFVEKGRRELKGGEKQ